MITGREQPDNGKLDLGETVQLAYVDQSRDDLGQLEERLGRVSNCQDIMRIGQYEIPSRAYVGRFNFRGADQQKKVGDLSGGERNRLHLAKLLRQGANVLLLDERRTISTWKRCARSKTRLLNFPGTILVISHDRWFLTGSRPTCSLSKATVTSSGSPETSAITKRTTRNAWARMQTSPSESVTKNLRESGVSEEIKGVRASLMAL
jgi:ATPase subunit of ABC transporter with duplicated ATPase domains